MISLILSSNFMHALSLSLSINKIELNKIKADIPFYQFKKSTELEEKIKHPKFKKKNLSYIYT